MAVGPGVDEVKAGDMILYNENAIHEKGIEHEGQFYFSLHINEVYGTIDDEETPGG